MLHVVFLAALVGCTGKKEPNAAPGDDAGAKPAPQGEVHIPKPSGPPFRDYADFKKGDASKKKMKGKQGCLPRGRYKLQVPGSDTSVIMVVTGDGGPRTLVVALHGGSGDAKTILDQTRWDGMAEVAGNMAVVVPHAAKMGDYGERWNTGKWDEGEKSEMIDASSLRDDVAYLDELVRYVSGDVCAERVLAAGFSNGGQMAQRWLCQGSEPDGAITAAGTLLVDPGTCKTARPIRGYIGTKDKLYTEPPLEGSSQPNAVESIEAWAKINQCNDAEPKVTKNGDESCKTWKGCTKTTSLCIVDGFPHGWPAPWSSKKKVPTNATASGWEWFEAQ